MSNDFECPRISASYAKFAELGKDVGFRRDPLLRRVQLQHLLADHNTQLDPRSGGPTRFACISTPMERDRRARFSSDADNDDIEHYFASGPPCRTAYEPADVPSQSETSSLLK